MVDSDARPLVLSAMTLRERVADIGRFIGRPTYLAQPMPWGRVAASVLLAVLLLNLSLSSLLLVLLETADERAGFLPELAELPPLRLRDMIGPVLLAPVFEELVFRSWLSGRAAALRFAVYGFAAVGIFLANYLLMDGARSWLAYAGLAVVFAGLVHWGMTRQRDTTVPGWFAGRFHWIVWGSTALFGLLHLGNHGELTNPLGVVIVLPQLVGGLLLAYTRTRIGLAAAILQHSLFNAVWFGMDFAGW
jgi:Type II CAAX prenyl endopeptidase Rce1-like